MTFVAIAQTAAFVILLAVWVAVMIRPRVTWVVGHPLAGSDAN